MPKLGVSTEPLTLLEWKATEGGWVEKGSVVLAVEADKIRSDVEAEISGFLHILLEAGSETPIGSVAGFLTETRAELATLQKELVKASEAVASATSEETTRVKTTLIEPKAESGERIPISPAARKLAEEHMIDIATVTATGPGGRIVREDIEEAIEAKGKATPEPAEAVSQEYQGRRMKSVAPLSEIRKTIAQNVHRSLQVAAQLTTFGEIDMAEVVKVRESLAVQAGMLGTRIDYTDILVFTLSRLLKTHPGINSSLIDNEIKVWESINIGVAVALDEGLVIPVVKDADKKSLVEISKNIKDLTEKARSGKLTPDEVDGSTFTVTNLGTTGDGYRFESVIINQPESATLGTGNITDRAVVRDGQIVISPIMTYSFTYDHRLIDGAMAARFVADLTKLLANPGLLLV